MRRFMLSLVVGLSLLVPVVSASAQTAVCEFHLGFATVHDMIPLQVGACVEDENHNPVNGDGLQHTTNGLMVWRKADNWTAFTDGYRTWINGPTGLQSRLNTERFPWEQWDQALESSDAILLDLAGASASTTDVINPKGNYTIAYHFDCTRAAAPMFTIAAKVPYSGDVDETGGASTAQGQGVLRFTKAGPHILEIQTAYECTWQITVRG